MGKFVGRERELKALEALYQTPGFQMSVIYGRRRIGKSTLIREFVKDKKAIYYTAVKSGISRNMELLSRQAMEVLMPGVGFAAYASFGSLESLFSLIGERGRAERIVVVIDELPYLVEADGSVLSVLQNYMDNQWQSGQIFLILCGSSISFMENEVLSEKSPIFGRRTSQIKLEAFDYLEAAEFVRGYSNEEKAICYGITGGVAKYLSLFDDSKSLDENITRHFFSKAGYLYEETNHLLTQEFRNVSSYNDVIGAVASGANRVSEIAGKAHLDATVVSHVISNLIATGIVVKEYAITDEKNKKKVQYNLKDGMFRFWYRFVPDGLGAVELGRGDAYYQKAVKPKLSEYMGSVFEDMCRFYTLNAGTAGDLNCFVTAVGKWWGTNPEKREQTDIDVVGLDKTAKKAVLGECKYKNEPMDRKVFEKLSERRSLIAKEYSVVQYLLFSKSGFSAGLLENADADQVKLVTLDELYEAEA